VLGVVGGTHLSVPFVRDPGDLDFLAPHGRGASAAASERRSASPVAETVSEVSRRGRRRGAAGRGDEGGDGGAQRIEVIRCERSRSAIRGEGRNGRRLFGDATTGLLRHLCPV
jgi:hypothetical protein